MKSLFSYGWRLIAKEVLGFQDLLEKLLA